MFTADSLDTCRLDRWIMDTNTLFNSHWGGYLVYTKTLFNSHWGGYLVSFPDPPQRGLGTRIVVT